MDEFEKELRATIEAVRRYARRNYFFGYIVAAITVVSSIAAGLSVSFAQVPREVTAALASLPAAMVASATVFRFEQKAAWFWRKLKKLEALLRSIRYEGLDVTAASKALSQLEVEMEQEWVSFGSPGKSHT